MSDAHAIRLDALRDVGADQLLARLQEISPHSAAHVQRVGATATLLAERMGMDSMTAAGVGFTGVLHDIGKTDEAIARIVNTPHRLTPEAREIVDRHTWVGGRLIADLFSDSANMDYDAMLADARFVAEHHHDPFAALEVTAATVGDERLLAVTKLIRITDVLDAVRDPDRPYRREPLSPEEARYLLLDTMGLREVKIFGALPEDVLDWAEELTEEALSQAA